MDNFTDKENKNKCHDYMTNEEYYEEFNEMIKNVESNRLLRYLHILIPKIIKEWH